MNNSIMHSDLFIKLSSEFDVGWNVDDVVKDFSEDQVDPNAKEKKRHGVYSDPSGAPHFQMFPSGIAFARNFSLNFPTQCEETASRLINLQNKIKSNNIQDSLTREFLNCNISSRAVNLIRITPGKNVSPHVDTTRAFCVNIGLKNSNLWKTNVYRSENSKEFEHSPKYSYSMNDKDVYILNVKNVHSVESTNYNLGKERYILTYTLKTR